MKRNIIKVLISACAVAVAVGGGVTASAAVGTGASHAVVRAAYGQSSVTARHAVPAPGEAIVVHETSADHPTLTADLQPDLTIPGLGTAACLSDPYNNCGWVFGAGLTAIMYNAIVANLTTLAVGACQAAAAHLGYPDLATACVGVVTWLTNQADPNGQCLFMSWDLPPILGYTRDFCS